MFVACGCALSVCALWLRVLWLILCVTAISARVALTECEVAVHRGGQDGRGAAGDLPLFCMMVDADRAMYFRIL